MKKSTIIIFGKGLVIPLFLVLIMLLPAANPLFLSAEQLTASPTILPRLGSLDETYNVDASNTAGPWDGSSSHPWQHITDGLNVAVNGDCITVRPGTYHERITISHEISLIGDDRETTIIDGADGNPGVVTITANNVVFSGFRIIGGHIYDIKIASSVNHVTVTNIHSTNPYEFGSAGIWLDDNANHNTISSSFFDTVCCYGIILGTGCTYNTITGNTMHDDLFHIDLYANCQYNTITMNTITHSNTETPQTIDWPSGIHLDSCSHNTITDNTISSTSDDLDFYGIHLESSTWNTINNNHITNNHYGMVLSVSMDNPNTPSIHNTIQNNIFTLDGMILYDDSYDNTILGNTVNGRDLIFLVGASDVAVQNAGEVILINCHRATIHNQNLSNATTGAILIGTDNSTITGNTIHGNTNMGIILYEESNGNFIADNGLRENGYSIRVQSSDDNLVTRNLIYGIYAGIEIIDGQHNLVKSNIIYDSFLELFAADCNQVCGNEIHGDGVAFMVESSDDNTISRNLISSIWGQGAEGVTLFASNGNIFYHNNFVDSIHHVVVEWQSSELWNLGYPYGGNYWDNYTGTDIHSGPNQNNPGSDGIGDTSLTVGANNNIDHYPLMTPYDYRLPTYSWVERPTQAAPGETIHICFFSQEVFPAVPQLMVNGICQTMHVSIADPTGAAYWQTITAPITSPVDITYRCIMSDDGTDYLETENVRLHVQDNDPPVFLADLTPHTGTTGEPLIFQVSVTDNVAVSRVSLTYTQDDELNRPVRMTQVGRTLWAATLTINPGSDSPYFYNFDAVDTVGNHQSMYPLGDPAMITITDNDPPVTRAIRTNNVITLVATDNCSPVLYTNITIARWRNNHWEGAEHWWHYTQPLEFTNGLYMVMFYSVDTVGNHERLRDVIIDTRVIDPRAIELVLPCSGDTLTKGSSQRIIWCAGKDIGEKVYLYLSSDSGKKWSLLTSTSSNNGVNIYPWTVPKNLPALHSYRLKVVSAQHQDSYSSTEGDFTIK
jgi:parallel beta-helix repeat protein